MSRKFDPKLVAKPPPACDTKWLIYFKIKKMSHQYLCHQFLQYFTLSFNSTLSSFIVVQELAKVSP